MSEPVPSSDSPDAESVRAELQRIVTSDAFSNAPILSRFLRYVVEQKINRKEPPLKEYTIGVEVFQRGVGFDPRVDTIVRVQARRLRKRLSRYYENKGRANPLRITIPKGHYHAEITAPVSAAEVAKEPAVRIVWHVAESGSRPQAFTNNTIPAPRTPLVGRKREVTELCTMFIDDGGPRLVTLTGPAGSGKTRLAVEVGLRLEEQFSSDVVYVQLAAVADAHTLQLELMHALGLRAVDNTPLIEILCRHLHSIKRASPLILDNFEQLTEAAPLIGSMLDACISLRVLVTSRVALHLYGEWEYPVAPLALPESDTMPLTQLAGVPAVELFVRRAAAAHPGFSLAAANADTIARICRHFDGLPLGIELAAAQCRALTPAQLLERFCVRLNVAASNVADVPDRQRTLRHAIEWSYKLLTQPERKLFRRLSAFSGGFTLESANAVANARGDLGIETAAGISRLQDHNLLRASSRPDETRYTMLETIREYGLEQLVASGEDDDVVKAHAAYYLALAEEGTGRLAGDALEGWLAHCDLEQDNFRTALDGLIKRGHGHWALRLVRALYWYWERRGYLAAARRTILSVLERVEPAASPGLWPQVACYAAAMEYRMGSPQAALAHFNHALAAARASGNQTMEIMALNSIVVFKNFAPHYDGALPLYEECLRLCETTGAPRETAATLSKLAVARLALGEHAAARGLMERARQAFHEQKQ